MYIKDLINANGNYIDENDMYDMIVVRTNIIQEMFVIKTYVLKRIKNVNPSMGKDVKIRNSYCVLVENKLQDIRYKEQFFLQVVS